MNRLAILFAGFALAGLGTPVCAQDAVESEENLDSSGGQITVYGWMAGATGEFRPFSGAPTLEFDNSFGEVLEDLDTAFFASALVRRERFVAVADVSYASLSRDGLVPPGIPASGEVSQLAITAAAGIRLEDSAELTIDVLAGARLWNLDGNVEVPLAGVSIAPEKTFVDPIVATRVNAQIAPRLSALVHVDIGGFGVGSDFTFQLLGTLNYRAGRRFYVSAGWRHLHLDYEDAGTRFEGSQTGPLIGFTRRF
jgi:hypothetical protein